MIDIFSSGIRIDETEYIKKKKNIIITLYGPYGDFFADLKEIARILSSTYGYSNCKLVSDRIYVSKERDYEESITDKSFYSLINSHVVVFIFFCDKRIKDKISHAESCASELTYLLDKLPNKIKCCFILREKGCKMTPVLFGYTKKFPILYESLEFKNNKEIAKMIQAKCRTFLEAKYHQILTY